MNFQLAWLLNLLQLKKYIHNFCHNNMILQRLYTSVTHETCRCSLKLKLNFPFNYEVIIGWSPPCWFVIFSDQRLTTLVLHINCRSILL